MKANQNLTNLKLSGYENALHQSVENADLVSFRRNLKKGANPYYEKNSKDIFDKIEDLKFQDEQRLYDAVVQKNVEGFVDALETGASYLFAPDDKTFTFDKVNDLLQSTDSDSQEIGIFMYEQLSEHKIRKTDSAKTADLMSQTLLKHEKDRTKSYFKNNAPVPKLPLIDQNEYYMDYTTDEDQCMSALIDLHKTPLTPNNTPITKSTHGDISDDESLESLKTHTSKYLNEKNKNHRSL
ncbi:MAG: hypothetical protein PQ612_04505 [Rickettsiales bacterium]|nr:hypothetical protein [Pseudomonadota bacterium]MDA0966124.1 hypothetical protein [Pseudomonadota bacterium]MDG4543211.1 hypothetical protein [Rickettsiales bacterium]MDG4545409.1 hypothetical protein [Rickettsiales bacterium]MDG4547858.1 hypothetical protein [Rickettsiales bacterium]